MIGILLNLREVTEENIDLLHQLRELVVGGFSYNFTLQINVTHGDEKIFEYFPADPRIHISINNLGESEQITNGMLRGRYNELDRHYVWFIDDDFLIPDVKHTATVLHRINEYMNNHPTCQIAKLAFNSAKNENIDFRFPIESTSLCCGLIIDVSRFPVFTQEQMRWNWKTDDFTMILNALDKGYGIDVHGHGVFHNIKTDPEDVTFDWDSISYAMLDLGYDSSDMDNQSDGSKIIIPYISKGNKPGVRDVLQRELNRLNGKNVIEKLGPKVQIVSTSTSSILIDNEILFNTPHSKISYISRRKNTERVNVITNQVRALDAIFNADVLIISAGHLNRPHYEGGPLEYFDPNELNTLEWNLKYLDKFLEMKDHGVVIFMGSVSADLGYPTQPLYAGEKSFYRNLCNSLRKRYRTLPDNFNFYYLTIPAVKSNMCDHGYNSRVIAEHISLLCGFNQEQFIIHSENLSYLNK